MTDELGWPRPKMESSGTIGVGKVDRWGPFVAPHYPDFMADALGCSALYEAMREKLREKREEGRGGWHRPDDTPIQDLYTQLHEHFDKGDMIDVANLAMMVWNRERRDGGIHADDCKCPRCQPDSHGDSDLWDGVG